MTELAGGLTGRLEASLQTMAASTGGPAAIGAVIVGDETAVVCCGEPAPDVHTVFELGSVGKTFTALLLAEMATRGEVGYDDPITAYLPPRARPRRASAAPITLVHLATHSAGLPHHPANFYLRALPAWWTNPFARYDLNDLYQATARIRVRNQPGARVRYSNFGVGLLGQLLANAAGCDYHELVIDRICRPLGMLDTRTQPDASCATGHRHGHPVPGWEMVIDHLLRRLGVIDIYTKPGTTGAVQHRRNHPVPGWKMGALAGAGTLRSSAADLLRYLQAQLHPETSPLEAALRAAQIPRVHDESRDHVCLVWNHRRTRRGDLLFHGGATRGFTAFVGFCPQATIGVAAVVNVVNTASTHRYTMIQTAYSLLKALVREHSTAVAQ